MKNIRSALNHCVAGNCRRIVLAVVGTAVLALAAATPAHAGHRDSGRFSARIQIGHRVPSQSCRVDPCVRDRSFALREHDRGYAVGSEAGFDAGYRDGLHRRAYDTCPTASFCNVSRAFEDGYREGFADAYADGFERGRCDRSCRPVPRTCR